MEEEKKKNLKKYIIGFIIVCSLIGGIFKIYNSEKQRQIAIKQAQLIEKQKKILEAKIREEEQKREYEKLEKEGPPDLLVRFLPNGRLDKYNPLNFNYIKEIINKPALEQNISDLEKSAKFTFKNYNILIVYNSSNLSVNTIIIDVFHNYIEIPSLYNPNKKINLGKDNFRYIRSIQAEDQVQDNKNNGSLLPMSGYAIYYEFFKFQQMDEAASVQNYMVDFFDKRTSRDKFKKEFNFIVSKRSSKFNFEESFNRKGEFDYYDLSSTEFFNDAGSVLGNLIPVTLHIDALIHIDVLN